MLTLNLYPKSMHKSPSNKALDIKIHQAHVAYCCIICPMFFPHVFFSKSWPPFFLGGMPEELKQLEERLQRFPFRTALVQISALRLERPGVVVDHQWGFHGGFNGGIQNGWFMVDFFLMDDLGVPAF